MRDLKAVGVGHGLLRFHPGKDLLVRVGHLGRARPRCRHIPREEKEEEHLSAPHEEINAHGRAFGDRVARLKVVRVNGVLGLHAFREAVVPGVELGERVMALKVASGDAHDGRAVHPRRRVRGGVEGSGRRRTCLVAFAVRARRKVGDHGGISDHAFNAHGLKACSLAPGDLRCHHLRGRHHRRFARRKAPGRQEGFARVECLVLW
mmetsp:Transcript_70228/g.156444  ORF Transcript_70228/g.156444 Transcript_70228/m.156444 type:complete len:206 (-) Transcript_70228:419-1036(-)